ncbi:MAG: SoxR reducing system RseC family protein [Phycisphaerae bacterium]|nr:SoxR reducing system RseC family protein [Phycisphaerae bacterium]
MDNNEINCETPNQTQNEHCTGCPNKDMCREVWAEENKGPLSPAGLVLSSIAAFLLPLICAIIAGSLAQKYMHDNSDKIQIVASLGGLIVGVLIAWPIVQLLKNKFPSEK